MKNYTLFEKMQYLEIKFNAPMERTRRFEILKQCKDWQNIFPDMSIKDCLFTLYNDRDITSSELDYLMEWMTI